MFNETIVSVNYIFVMRRRKTYNTLASVIRDELKIYYKRNPRVRMTECMRRTCYCNSTRESIVSVLLFNNTLHKYFSRTHFYHDAFPFRKTKTIVVFGFRSDLRINCSRRIHCNDIIAPLGWLSRCFVGSIILNFYITLKTT